MLVKICGITTLEDARFALEAGADWIGLNLVAGPRQIDLARAQAILSKLDDPSRGVALLAAEKSVFPGKIAGALRDYGLFRLQVYGDVTPDVIHESLDGGFEVIAVRSITGGPSLAMFDEFARAFGDARPDYVLFDAGTGNQLGGTGRLADWEAIRAARDAGRCEDWPPVILAGGLNPENVGEAIRLLAPAGVDVSSGVESAPGRKDHARIEAFLAAVRGRPGGG